MIARLDSGNHTVIFCVTADAVAFRVNKTRFMCNGISQGVTLLDADYVAETGLRRSVYHVYELLCLA